jgi:hypothetical protein
MNSTKLNAALAAPGSLTYVSTATTGGSLLAATTYFARVSALMAAGPVPTVFESLAAAQGAGQLTGAGNTNTVTISFAVVPGATAYAVYFGLTGAPRYYATVPASAAVAGVITVTITSDPTATTSRTVLGASTALAGNAFLAGGDATLLQAAGTSGPGAVAGTPFIAGRLATVQNPTGGAIVLQGSSDGVTFNVNQVLDRNGVAIGANVPTLASIDIVLPNYLVAASAGLILLGSP